MAITVGVFGVSGQGKTTSIVVNPDGTYNLKEYAGMSPEDTVIINSDKKNLPFQEPTWEEGKNLFITSEQTEILSLLSSINKGSKVKSVIIDTIQGIIVDYEMLESRKLTFDKWADLAKGVYEMITFANAMRKDVVVYIMGHVTLYTDVDGNESKCLITNGKKMEKIKLESKLPIVLFTSMERGIKGDNLHYFETQSNRSTGKSPIGMFSEFRIPNSLKLVDTKIREYYKL